MLIEIDAPKNEKALEGCVLVFSGGRWKPLPKEAYLDLLLRELESIKEEAKALRSEFAEARESQEEFEKGQREKAEAFAAKVNAKLGEYHDIIKEIAADE